MMRPQFDARKQILRVELAIDPVMIDGDSTRLEQVVSNLLSNAHKYTGDGGIIEVSVGTSEASDTESPQAVVRVSDNGEGIDPDLLPSLFNSSPRRTDRSPIRRADSASVCPWFALSSSCMAAG